MQDARQAIAALLSTMPKFKDATIHPLPQSGSDRQYFRVKAKGRTLIGTFGLNTQENATFCYFSRHFAGKKLPVPEIIAMNEAGTAYLQEDLGSTSLLNALEANGYTSDVFELFKKSLSALAAIQVKGDDGLDYSQCLTASEFGQQAIMSDLLYFKYYFLDTLRAPYDKQEMMEEFTLLSSYLAKTEYKFFMFRDFQSRNIMIRDGEPFFIDYQGGMKGAPQYDAASMIWQARANLPEAWKEALLQHYIDELDTLAPGEIDRSIFTGQYYGYILIRLLQVLGAYGFRGLFERKAQFLTSIPQALGNLKWFLDNHPLPLHTPEFTRMLNHCISAEVLDRFSPLQANDDTPLTVYINSFSYLKNGYPQDESQHGGGYVFDCRGLLNPGRVEAYKTQSGMDKPVMDYLEQQTKMPNFLNSVFDLVDINVEDYLQRNFDRLSINFGCTGGQHRSVYAAEQTARHLRNKYKVKTVVQHLNRENWKRKEA